MAQPAYKSGHLDKRLDIILQPAIVRELFDNSIKSTRFLGFIESQGNTIEQADELQIPLILEDAKNFKWFGDRGALNANEEQGEDVAKLQWKNCAIDDVIVGAQLVKSMSPKAVINYAQGIFRRMQSEIKKGLEKDLLQSDGTDPNKPEGAKAMLDGSKIYEELDPTTYPKWKPVEIDASQTTYGNAANELVLDHIEVAIRKATDDTDEEIMRTFMYGDLDVVSTLVRKYQALYQPVALNKVDAGIKRPHYSGVPLYGSTHVGGSGVGFADNSIYGFNAGYLHFGINPNMPDLERFRLHTMFGEIVRMYKMVAFGCSFRARQFRIHSIRPEL